MALLIDYAPPKKVSRRGDWHDSSAIYSTLPGREGYLELFRLAGRIGRASCRERVSRCV